MDKYSLQLIEDILDIVGAEGPEREIARDNLIDLVESDPLIVFLNPETLESNTAAYLDGFEKGLKAGK